MDEVIIESEGGWSLDLDKSERDPNDHRIVRRLKYNIIGEAREVGNLCKKIMEETESEMIKYVLDGRAGEPQIYPYWAH